MKLFEKIAQFLAIAFCVIIAIGNMIGVFVAISTHNVGLLMAQAVVAGLIGGIFIGRWTMRKDMEARFNRPISIPIRHGNGG